MPTSYATEDCHLPDSNFCSCCYFSNSLNSELNSVNVTMTICANKQKIVEILIYVPLYITSWLCSIFTILLWLERYINVHHNAVWQVFPAYQEVQGLQAFLDQPVPPVPRDSAVIQVLRDYLADLALRDFLAVQAGQVLPDGQALPVCYLYSFCL